MHIRRITLFLVLVIVLLALSGAAEAAIASSGGGLSSSLTGTGISSAASSLSAGHSASASKMLTQTITSAGAFSTTTSGTDSATDGTVTVNVQATILKITGSLDGPGTATATAQIEANGDEGPVPLFPQLWVNTLIEAFTQVIIPAGLPMDVHGTATASATGTATARGTMAGVGTVTAMSQGTATSSSDARDIWVNGARASGEGVISSDAAIDNFGTDIGLGYHNPELYSVASTAGIATASATTSGTSRATGTSAIGSGTVVVSGRTGAGAASAGDLSTNVDTTGQAIMDGQFMNTPMGGWIFPVEDAMIRAWSNAHGQDGVFPYPAAPSYQGSANAFATGSVSVNGADQPSGSTYRISTAGTVSSGAGQIGAGQSTFLSAIEGSSAIGAGTSANLHIPRTAFGNDYAFIINGAQNNDMSDIISSGTVTETGNAGGGSASANGNAATLTTVGAALPAVPGDQTRTSASGSTAVSGSADGIGTLVATADIMSVAAADGTANYFLGGIPAGSFDTDAGAVSYVAGSLEIDPLGGIPADVSGSVSANGATTGTATFNDGVRQAHASSNAKANLQGSISGHNADPQFGADSYGFAFTGSTSTGGVLFDNAGLLAPPPTATTDFAITQSALEANGLIWNVLNPTAVQTAGGRIVGGAGHGDTGFTVAGVRSASATSDVSGGTDVNTRLTNAIGFSATWVGSTQGAAYFPLPEDVSNAWTVSDAATRTDIPTGAAPGTGSLTAGLTGVRTSGRGTFDSIVPDDYTVSSDASLSGGMKSTLATTGVSNAFSRTAAHVDSLGTHAVTADTDDAAINAFYLASDMGMDGMDQRGTAAITGLSLAGHAASEADSARLSLTGGSAQVNLYTLPNIATITFPIRSAILGGAPAATLGMNQGVQTLSSVTNAPNYAWGVWAGAVDSENPAVTAVFPMLP